MKRVILIIAIAITMLACSKENKSDQCTVWKEMCVGDTVFYSYNGDTATCIIKKIIFRPHTVGDLLGAECLNGEYWGADESHFNWR